MAGVLKPDRTAVSEGGGDVGSEGSVAALVRLKFTILGHGSGGLKVSRLIFWPLAVLASWGAVLLAGGSAARHDVLLLVLVLWAVGWLIGPVLASGPGVLRPEFFSLLPLGRKRLGLSLLAVACVGYGPVAALLSFAAVGVHAVGLESRATAASLALALLCLPPLLVFVVALSRSFYALVGAGMGSRFGVVLTAINYGALIAGLIVGWLAISVTQQGLAAVLKNGLPGQSPARALEAFPTSWPVLATEAAADGRPLVAVGWLLALVLAAAAMAAVCAYLLLPRPVSQAPRRRFRPLGSRWQSGRPLLPATPLGAVVGRELRQWWRDPWRSLELQCAIWAVVFMGAIGLVTGVPQIMPFAGMAMGLLAGLVACNLLGQDGTSLWLTVVGAGPRTIRDDIRGRQIALLLLFAPPAVLLTVVLTLISGQHWAWPLVFTVLPALLGAGVGTAVLLSVVAGAQGVDPKYRVGPNDAGDVSFQTQIALYGTALAALPALAAIGAALLLGGAEGPGALLWAAVPVGLLNGAFAAWLFGRIAHRRLTARLPETFVRFRYGKTLAAQQQPEGNAWLDRMERGAIAGNEERKPIGT